jgi:4-hydroxy-3-polyprenylbenzoate decarboxylase
MSLQTLLEHHRHQVNRKSWADLRCFSKALRDSGQLKEVPHAVSNELEVTTLCHRSLVAGGPALLFKNPMASEIQVLGNLFGRRARILLALELDDERGLRALGEHLAFLRTPNLPGDVRTALATVPEFASLIHVTPVKKQSARWQRNVAEGPEVDLERLPVSTCWPGDAGPLISFGMAVTRGPSRSRVNLAIYRQQVIGRNKVIMRWLPHRGGAQDFREHQQQNPGEPFPVSVVIGADPATLLAAVTPIPDTLSEYQFAGLLRGSRSRVVHSQLTGLPLPCSAEIVLEGHINPGETAVEGPFADHTGYYNSAAEFPVLTVERISHRDQPVYLTTYMGKPGEDEPSILASALNEVFIPLLQAQFPEVVDFYLPPEACSYRVAIVSIRKQYPGHARRIMFGIWSWLRQFTYTKTIIVTDDDIDIRDWKEVIWAIATRADPARDTVLVENTPIDYLDFASPRPGLGGKMGIDATHKVKPESDRTWGRVAKMDGEVQGKMEHIAAALGL